MTGAEADGLWLSLSEIAERKGVSVQAVSVRARRFIEQGALRCRRGPKGTKQVPLADFDRLVERTQDGVRAANGTGWASRGDGMIGDPVLAQEQARKMAAEATLKELELDARLGKVLLVEDVRQAYAGIAEDLVRVVDGLPGRADELMAAARRDDKAAFQAVLRDVAHALRLQIGRGLEVAPEPQVAEDGA